MGWKKWAGSWKKVKYCCPFPVLPSCQNGCLLESTSRTQNIYLLFSLQLFTSPISNPSTFQFLKCRLVYLFILTNSDRVVWHVDSLVCALSKDLKEVFSLSWQPIMPPHIERWDRSSNFLLILDSGSAHCIEEWVLAHFAANVAKPQGQSLTKLAVLDSRAGKICN